MSLAGLTSTSFSAETQICSEFLPEQVTRAEANRSMVDLCVGMTIDPESDIASILGGLIHEHPPGLQTINQTNSPATNSVPCIVPIKFFNDMDVGVDSSQEDFVVQALWARTYFNRFRKLKLPGPPVRKLTYPMIAIRQTEWRLAFAREQHGKVNVYKTMRLGDTSDLTRLYLLVNNLKILGQWVQEEFGRWFNSEMNKFDECKKEWLLQRLDELPTPEPETDEDDQEDAA
jgi:hypothetical protein